MTDLAAMLAESEDALADLRDVIDEAWSELTENPDIKRRDDADLSGVIREALDAAYKQGEEETGYRDAADHLRAYLVAQGLPANPVKLDDPHLDALARVLL